MGRSQVTEKRPEVKTGLPVLYVTEPMPSKGIGSSSSSFRHCTNIHAFACCFLGAPGAGLNGIVVENVRCNTGRSIKSIASNNIHPRAQ